MHIFFAIALLLGQSLVSPSLVAQSFAGGSLPIDGIQCNSMEGAVEHIHSHLQMFDNGHPVGIPAQIGIPQTSGCLYWVHTHTADGVIHMESPVTRTFTLGEFFDIWGTSLNRTTAATMNAPKGKRLSFWVNGKRWTGDPASIPLRDREEIVIANGAPGHLHPADWSKL